MEDNKKLVILIARQHGTGGKEIASLVAKKLGIAFYAKEEIMKFAYDNNIVEENVAEKDLYNFYLSLDAEKDSIIKQTEVIKKLLKKEV